MAEEINPGGIDRALRSHLKKDPTPADFLKSEERVTRTHFIYYFKNNVIHVENRR